MTFLKCEACGRLRSARVSLPPRAKLTEDAAMEREDGSFQCPFCVAAVQPFGSGRAP
jgi:hypothetical protein